MAGIKDIAKLAGVSIGTVDRVLHNRGRCADETRERVLAAMKTLKYTPNLTARNLKRNESCKIALLQPKDNQDNGFWEVASNGAQRAFREFSPFNVEIVSCPFDRYSEADFRRAGREALECRGILLAPVLPAAARKFCELAGDKPLVTYDSFLDSANVIQSFFQQGEIAGQTAADFVSLACKADTKTAVLAYESENPNINLRVEGFCRKIMQAGFARPDCFCVSEDIGFSELEVRLKKENISLDEYGAIFVAKTGTYKYARLLNADRHKVFIVGFDLIHENIEQLKNGGIDLLISQNVPSQVFSGIKTLVNKILYNLAPQRKIIHMPCDILTRTNIDTYLEFSENILP